MRHIDDREISSKVRALLVKFAFDTSILSIGVHRGNVLVMGTLKETLAALTAKVKQRIEDDPFMSHEEKQNENFGAEKKLEMMDGICQKIFLLETEVRKLQGVKNINLEFSNYKKSGSVWKRKS